MKYTTLFKIIAVIVSVVLCVAIFKTDTTLRINGCTYDRTHLPDGTEIVTHSDVCGCTDTLIVGE